MPEGHTWPCGVAASRAGGTARLCWPGAQVLGRGRERGLWVGLRRMLEFCTRERKGMPDGSVGKGSAGAGLGQGTA